MTAISRKSPYAHIISELAPPRYNPRHVEAYIRLEYSTLDHLSREAMAREVDIACACIDAVGDAAAERCAQSFSL